MEKHMFLATVADGQTLKQLLHGAKGRKTANTHPESTFWVGPWALVESGPLSDARSPTTRFCF